MVIEKLAILIRQLTLQCLYAIQKLSDAKIVSIPARDQQHARRSPRETSGVASFVKRLRQADREA